MNCKTCDEPLSKDPGSLRYNCGGDCIWCMARAGDPDCVARVVGFMIDDCLSACKIAVEEFATEVGKLDYDVDLFYTRIQEGFRAP